MGDRAPAPHRRLRQLGAQRAPGIPGPAGGSAPLTGHLGLGDWSWEPTVICGLLAAAAGYALAWRRGVLRDDDDVSPWLRRARSRVTAYAAGLVVAALALLSPIDRGGDQYLFAIHMLQHLMLMMVAPPLLILGLAGGRAQPLHGWPRLRHLGQILTQPWIALVVFNAVMLVWHIPALYNTTLTTEPIHVVEHLSFIAVGLLFWWPIVDPLRTRRGTPVTPLTKIAVLVISGIPPTVLGLIFALSPAAFYSFYVHAPRLWGISPVFDQQIGGIVMLGLGNIIYFVPILLIFMRLLGDSSRDEEEAAARLGAVHTRA